LSQFFIFDLRDRHQLDVPTPLSCPFQKPERVIDFCAVYEFDSDVRFVGEDAAKLNAGCKQDAAVLDFFRRGLNGVFYQGSYGFDDLKIFRTHQSDVFKQTLNRFLCHLVVMS